MKIWMSPYLNENFTGWKKPVKRWVQYLLVPFHFDKSWKFIRVLFWCLRWGK